MDIKVKKNDFNGIPIDESLDEFRTVLKGIKNLSVPMDEPYLTRFLMAKKFDIEEAVGLIKRYYEIKKLYDNMSHVRISGYKYIHDTKFQTVLKNRDALGRKVLYIQTRHWDVSSTSMDEMTMSTFFILHEMSAEEETQRNGVQILIDNRGVTFSQATGIVSMYSVKLIRRIIMFFQGSYPLRLKGIHIIGTPFIIEKLANAFKLFMKKKLRNRFHIHSGDFRAALHEKINPEILPESLGGQIPDDEVEDTELMKSLYLKEEYYHDHWKYGFEDSS